VRERAQESEIEIKIEKEQVGALPMDELLKHIHALPCLWLSFDCPRNWKTFGDTKVSHFCAFVNF
jgi:hypothetical protein